MKLSFLSLASGSSGNCYYLGTSEFGMLIDAGIGIRTIKKVLKDRSIDFTKIVAVLITHDHADHIGVERVPRTYNRRKISYKCSGVERRRIIY